MASGIAFLLVACGEPDWRKDREPVAATDYGGALQADPALEYDAPMRTVYDPPTDLTLSGRAGSGTPADSIRRAAAREAGEVEGGAPAGGAQPGPEAQDTARPATARDTASVPSSDSGRAERPEGHEPLRP